jgi:3-deoxy-manno-octulosonate cytidylyltransferase (CMP-KDO synthetase)
MKVVAIIPARMGSSRFPGKPLADIAGLPMIEHVRRRVSLCAMIDEVIVATCDKEIMDVVEKNGGRAAMTLPTHERCTDRIAEAALEIDADIVLNVQGDEPLVKPEMFEPLITPLMDDPELYCVNLMSEIGDEKDFESSDIVKVVCDLEGYALYFSREPVPSRRKAGGLTFKRYKQLGIIAFRKDFLLTYTKLTPTPLEQIESVDMLRILEHGYRLRMVPTPLESIGVDTPADLERASEMMKKDALYRTYL